MFEAILKFGILIPEENFYRWVDVTEANDNSPALGKEYSSLDILECSGMFSLY